MLNCCVQLSMSDICLLLLIFTSRIRLHPRLTADVKLLSGRIYSAFLGKITEASTPMASSTAITINEV